MLPRKFHGSRDIGALGTHSFLLNVFRTQNEDEKCVKLLELCKSTSQDCLYRHTRKLWIVTVRLRFSSKRSKHHGSESTNRNLQSLLPVFREVPSHDDDNNVIRNLPSPLSCRVGEGGAETKGQLEIKCRVCAKCSLQSSSPGHYS